MKKHRLITAATIMAVAGFLAAPLTSDANSLLSGYGGPGTGSQAILGATLLNGPGSGGSSGAGGSSAGGSSGGGAGLATSSGTPSKAHARPRGHTGKTAAKVKRAAHGNASSSASATYKSPSGTSVGTQSAVESSQIGLSNSDLWYILLAAGLLVLTGTLTRRLARPTE